ncbi:MAG: shikimate dehydrogenase [Acidimicrobiales bacterium]
MDRRSPQWPSGASAVVGVVGDPITHSLSPLLHNAAFDAMGLDWVSVAFPVPAGSGEQALRGALALGIVGLSVTMPHKEIAAATCDEVSPLAARLGAVNCVTARRGRLVGDSTDGAGFLAALARATGREVAGQRCVVVGAGGAARAIVLALAGVGASEVVVVNRDRARAEAAAALAGAVGRVGDGSELSEAAVVVQATPAGMSGAAAPAMHPLVDPLRLHAGQVVVDTVYNPLETPLLAAARDRGATAVNGVGMLVHQAALALEQWTGREVPVEALWDAARARLGPADR